MKLYTVILYAHIACAMGMAAGVAILTVEEAAARRASTPGELRTILERDERTASFVKAMALLMTTKAGWAVTLAAFVTALALGALSGVLLPQK